MFGFDLSPSRPPLPTLPSLPPSSSPFHSHHTHTGGPEFLGRRRSRGLGSVNLGGGEVLSPLLLSSAPNPDSLDDHSCTSKQERGHLGPWCLCKPRPRKLRNKLQRNTGAKRTGDKGSIERGARGTGASAQAHRLEGTFSDTRKVVKHRVGGAPIPQPSARMLGSTRMIHTTS